MHGCEKYISGQRGYSYVELVAALTIIAVLVAIAIDRLMPLQVDAERTALENTVGALRSALGIKVAELLSSGNSSRVPTLIGINPMDLLAEQPKNYRGVRAGAGSDIESGQWYFDSGMHMLVYRVINSQSFTGESTPYARVRFKVELVFADTNGNRDFDPGVDVVSGARLAAVTPYRWTDLRNQDP